MRLQNARRILRPAPEPVGRRKWIPALHLFALWVFAVTQPLLELLGREPDFLVAHRLTGATLVGLVIALSLGIPALLATPILVPLPRRSRAGLLWSTGLCGLLTGAFLLQLLHWLPASAALVLAFASGTGFAICLRRYEHLSNLLAIAAILALVSPFLFLLRPGVRGLLHTTSSPDFEPDPIVADAPPLKSDLPIVLLVFDELPTSSLQLRDGSINDRRFPSFAALAEESTWYRRAVTTATHTSKAIPALLTGQLPRPDATAHYNDHSSNLFSWLGVKGDYEVIALESMSNLCPPAVCTEQVLPNTREALTMAVDDLAVVYAHLLLPPTLRTGLPDVSNTWTGFRSGARADRGMPGSRWNEVGVLHREVPFAVDTFLHRIDRAAAGQGPTFFYFHQNLPHLPWRYLPSGREYMPIGMPLLPPGFESARLTDDEDRTTHGLQRHILQVGYADRVLGLLTDSLRRAGIYDRALVVVTADHGCSFRPRQQRRWATDANVEDVLEVPLFVKHPGQREGEVLDHVVRTVDIVPTIAAALGTIPPWKVDGKPLGDTSPREITACCYPQPKRYRSFRTDPTRRQETLDRLHGLFGDGTPSQRDRLSETTPGHSGNSAHYPQSPNTEPFDGVFAVGPRPDLLGRRVADLTSQHRRGDSSPTLRAELTAKHSYENVRPESGFVPSLISGRIEPSVPDGTKLAIAVDGIVRATTETFTHQGSDQFLALVHERWLTGGKRQIAIYLIDEASETSDESLLRPVPTAASPQLLLKNGRVESVTLPSGEVLSRDDSLFRMTVNFLSGGFLGSLVHASGDPPPVVDEFLLFDGSDFLYRGTDDPWLRRTRTRRDEQIQTSIRFFTPAVTAERQQALRLLARSGDRFQDVSPSTNLLGMFELVWSEQGRPNALLRRPMGFFETEPERIGIVANKEGIVGFLGAPRLESTTVSGWVTDIKAPGSTLEVVAFLGGTQVWVDKVKFPRPGVARRYGPEHRASGFKLFDPLRQPAGSRNKLTAAEIETLRQEGVIVYAVSPRGVAARVRFQYGPLQRESPGVEVLPVTDGRLLPVRPPGDGFDGAIDLVTKPGDRTLIEGWAADLERREAPRQIVIYRDGKFLANLGANRDRPDIVEHHGDERLLRTGFRGPVPGTPDPGTFAERHRVFAIMLRGVAVELPYLSQPAPPP